MKMNYNKFFISILGAVMAVNLFLPALLFAQGTPAERGFCARVNEVDSLIDQRIVDREARLQEKSQERTNNLDERRNERDSRLLEYRIRRDENRQEHYDALEARAETDAQKQAVIEFKAAVEEAIAARKSAIDEAIQAFRTDIDQAIASRKSAVDAAVTLEVVGYRGVHPGHGAQHGAAQSRLVPLATDVARDEDG